MGWYLSHKGLLAPPPPSQCDHVAYFGTFFKNFHVRLGKTRKNVSFYRGVCVKAKLTLVSFFSFLFFAPFPYLISYFDFCFYFYFDFYFLFYFCFHTFTIQLDLMQLTKYPHSVLRFLLFKTYFYF